jgi:hypothetical protein
MNTTHNTRYPDILVLTTLHTLSELCNLALTTNGDRKKYDTALRELRTLQKKLFGEGFKERSHRYRGFKIAELIDAKQFQPRLVVDGVTHTWGWHGSLEAAKRIVDDVINSQAGEEVR